MTKSLEKLLSTAFLVPMNDPNSESCIWGLNILLWGDPGIGKSDRIEAAGVAVGLPVRTIYISTTQPEDASGTAFPNTTKAVAMFEAAVKAVADNSEGPLVGQFPEIGTIAQAMVQAGHKMGRGTTRIEPLLAGVTDLILDQQGILFLDEFSCARPAVQGAWLSVPLKRMLGGRPLGNRTRVVAAANPTNSAAGGWDLSPPMANRFCHLDIEVPSAKDWSEWLVTEKGEAIPEIEDGENIVRQNWPTEWPIAKGKMAGFMHTIGRTMLHNLPDAGDEKRSHAWPSPRTWVFATRVLATAACLGIDNDVRDQLIFGCVGEAAGSALVTWLLNTDIPTPRHMIDNGWVPDARRLDKTFAAYTTLLSYVCDTDTKRSQKERVADAVGAWKCLQQGIDANLEDIVLQFTKSMVKAGFTMKTDPAIEKVAKPIYALFAKSKYNDLAD